MQFIAVAIFGGLAIWFGAMVFRTSSMARSAFSLLASMVALGGMYFALEAEFLGVLQLMMMAVEMAIMAIFMVMFMMDPGGLGEMDMSHQKRASIGVGAAGAIGALAVVILVEWGQLAGTAPSAEVQVRALGEEMMMRSMLIFEVAGITILTTMIAAIAVSIVRSKR